MRKKGLVERLIMKNPSDEDFSCDKLPPNRRKLFSYMLKNKLWRIYKNHLLTALFFLPLIAWGILTLNYTGYVFGLDPQEGITHLFEYWFTVYVTAIPLWVIAFVGLAGGLHVIRKLAWGDPVVLKTDFLRGIKASGKQLALIGFLWGVVHATLRYAIDWLGFYYRVFDDSYSVIFGIFVCLFLLIVLIGLTVYMSCMASQYNVTFKQLTVGAFKLYFADVFLSTGVILLCLLPFILMLFIELAVAVLVMYLLILGLLLGFLIIPPFLVCQHTFDRIINKKDYPSYYGKGLSYGTYDVKKGLSDAEESGDDATDAGEAGEQADTEAENDFERINDDQD